MLENKENQRVVEPDKVCWEIKVLSIVLKVNPSSSCPGSQPVIPDKLSL